MSTSKATVFISYNSESFLKNYLDSLYKSHQIMTYIYIRHLPDVDDSKVHFHVYIKPNKVLDLMDIKENSAEFDPLHPDKPLKFVGGDTCNNYNTMLLYFVHNKLYLERNPKNGKVYTHFYDITDVVSSEDSDLIRQQYDEACFQELNNPAIRFGKRLLQDKEVGVNSIFLNALFSGLNPSVANLFARNTYNPCPPRNRSTSYDDEAFSNEMKQYECCLEDGEIID